MPLIFALAAAAALPILTLAGDGLGLPGKAMLRFGVAETEAVATLTGVLGKPLRRGTYPDCGQGIPIGHVHFRGGLEATFIKHRFVGWSIDEGGYRGWRSAKGIGFGSSFAAVKRAQPDADTLDTGESVFLLSETGPAGFLSGKGSKAVLTGLHAGQTCIVT